MHNLRERSIVMMKTKRSFRRAGCWRSDKDTIKAQTQASNKVFKKETKVASEYTEEKKASPNNAKRSRPDAEKFNNSAYCEPPFWFSRQIRASMKPSKEETEEVRV